MSFINVTDLQIEHAEIDQGGSFFVKGNVENRAELNYQKKGDHIIISHTMVDGELEGLGIGTKLVYAAIDYAQKEGVKVLPLCSFAENIFYKDKSLHQFLK